MSKKRYRIVRDGYLGFEAQVRFWRLPIWLQLGRYGGYGVNTNRTVEEAREVIARHKGGRVIEYVE